ncbi:hypothetical protein BQ8420_01835 [Nocardiopsis sp. JB363]|nr:hypothetical protein BQ8420_01835 [Nocardiopsis sp. JB363]
MALGLGLFTCVFLTGLAFLALRSIDHRMRIRWNEERPPPTHPTGHGSTHNVVGDVHGSGVVMQADRIDVHVISPPGKR